MREKLVQARLRDLSTAQVRHVRAVRYRDASGDVARIYQELERDFGVLAPPVVLHAPASDVLAATWLTLRETLLVLGSVPRAHKEAVSTAVSEGNSCPFCISIHSSMLSDLVGYRDDAISDPAARAAADWATANAVLDDGIGKPVPFPFEQAPEMVGTAVVLQYLNRMANLFLGELPLPPRVPTTAIGVVRRVLAWLIKSAERRGPQPGSSLDLLPEAPLPPDLAWASGNAAIAEAFARGAAAIEKAGRRSVAPEVRELVLDRLSQWDGRPLSPSRAWAADTVAVLPAQHRPAGHLALLTALASYQVDQTLIDQFRAQSPDDRSLIDVTSWSGFAAARRAGSWMTTRPGTTGTESRHPGP